MGGELDPSDEKVRALRSLRLPQEAAPAQPEARAGRRALPWVLLALSAALNAWLFARGDTATGVAGTAGTSEARPLDESQGAASAGTPVVPPAAGSAPSPGGLTAGAYLAIEELIPISAATDGRVKKVLVKAGDKVTAGQALVALEDGELRAQLELAKARLRDTQRTLDRVKVLAQSQAATKAEEDRALGQMEIAAAEAELAARRLDQARLTAPIAGTILEVGVKPGEVVELGGKALLKLADLSSLVAEATVNELEVARLAPGQEAEVVVDAAPGRTFRGQVREIARQADRARGTVLVKVSVLEPDPSLRPGMSARVSFRPAR